MDEVRSEVIAVRVTRALKHQVEKLAREDQRSGGGYVELRLQEHVADAFQRRITKLARRNA